MVWYGSHMNSRLPETDHVCEPGSPYARICQACETDVKNGFARRFNGTLGEAKAVQNRAEAARRRAFLSGQPVEIDDPPSDDLIHDVMDRTHSG